MGNFIIAISGRTDIPALRPLPPMINTMAVPIDARILESYHFSIAMSDSRSSLSAAFRGLTTTAISPGSPPSAQSASSNAVSHREASITGAISTAASVASVVGEVAKAVTDVPYVGAIATIVTTLIKIREEVETNKERCQELLDRVLEKIEEIFTHLLDLKECDSHGDMKRLETQMRKYHDFLKQVVETVINLQKRRLYQRVLDRGTSELERLDRRINSLDSKLILGVIMEILKTNKAQRQGNNCEVQQEISISTHFPPAPICILEREEQHRDIVAELLSNPSARVALLGMGGIGKTTLASSIARDPLIVESYPRRLFLSLEGCSTSDLAYTKIATTFKVPAGQRGSHDEILSHVLSYLSQKKTLFVVDNFETWWEAFGNRRDAEEFLGQLASLQELAMIVTLRGIQRPASTVINWLQLKPLPTLTQNGSMDLLSILTKSTYTDSDLEYVQKLLKAVAGIPLAVTLIGALLGDESETPQSLWNQWTRESTQAIGIVGDVDSDDHRLYKLDISLKLSIFGPRMNDNAKEVLAAVAILPTGLSMDDNELDELQALLAGKTRVRDCIRTLQNVALVTLDSSTSPHRLQMLPPVRDFCLQHLPLDGEVIRRLTDAYNANLRKHWDWGSSNNYRWVTTELSNITAIIKHAITLCYVTDDFRPAIQWYTAWRRYLCMPETDTVERAIGILSEHPQAQAECLQSLGDMLSDFNQEREAIQPLEQALFIHRELGVKNEEGWDLYLLGCTHKRLDDYAKAEHCLNEAKDLFIGTGNKWRQGAVLNRLVDVYLKQDKLPQAECSAEEALELCRVSGNRDGELQTLLVLGRVYRVQGKYDLAIEKLKVSRDASQAIHHTRGEALANEYLGDTYRAAGQPDRAAMHFRLAASIYERVQLHKGVEECRAALEELGMSLDTPE